jgi:hypothetical protein
VLALATVLRMAVSKCNLIGNIDFTSLGWVVAYFE